MGYQTLLLGICYVRICLKIVTSTQAVETAQAGEVVPTVAHTFVVRVFEDLKTRKIPHCCCFSEKNLLTMFLFYRFLLQCLEDLDNSLRKLNSRLFVVRGQPADALPKLFREWGTTELTFEEDPEPYGRVRDHNIMSKCREVGITVISRVSHTLYKLDK